MYFTAVGKYCLECESNGNIRWYDTATGQETVLSKRETKELGSLADVTYTYSRYLSAACNRKDGVLMAVRLEENGMTLWLDGQEKYVEAPDGAPLQMAMGSVTGRQLAVGTSGHVLVSGFADEQDVQMDFLWCYDSLQDSWSRLDVPTELLGCKVWVGSENRAVVVDMEANLFVLNLTTGRMENQTELLFPLSAIAQMELVLEDQYMMVRTQDKQLIIGDPEEETLLYYQTLEYHNQLTATYDGAGRLYISWENGGICIQTDSWQLLTEIPDMLCYHVQSGRILQSRYVYISDGLEQMLILKQMPDTDSLIGIAKALLGRT